MSGIVVHVPGDAAAVAVGADRVAQALQAEAAARGLVLRIVRNGSRGLLWLEPMIEVATPAGRIAYGPVAESDVPGLLDAGLIKGGAHALRIGEPAAARRKVTEGLAQREALAQQVTQGNALAQQKLQR